MRISTLRSGSVSPVAVGLAATAALCALSAFTHVDPEAESLRRRQRQADAYALAVGGLERFSAERAVARTGTPDTAEEITFAAPGGSATVQLVRLHQARGDQPALYLIRSRGMAAAAGRQAPAAEQIVTQLATWQPARFTARAAWTTVGQPTPTPEDAVSGTDRCGRMPAIPAVSAEARGAGIDWLGIVEGTALPRRATASADELARYSNGESWPIIRVDGDHELRSHGRGTLIVTGDLRIVGGHTWRGLVLAGGRVELRRGAVVRGALVSGLNQLIDLAPAGADRIDPRARVQYDSCDLARAADAFGALALVPDTRVNGWLSR